MFGGLIDTDGLEVNFLVDVCSLDTDGLEDGFLDNVGLINTVGLEDGFLVKDGLFDIDGLGDGFLDIDGLEDGFFYGFRDDDGYLIPMDFFMCLQTMMVCWILMVFLTG